MVDAHQNVNGSRDVHVKFQLRFIIRGLALSTVNLSAKFEVSIYTHYEDIKGDTKRRHN